MKMIASVSMAAMAASAALAQAPARDAPAPTGTAVIRGRVIAAAGQRPLAKVEVRATASAIRVNKAVLTDANGRYEIADLPAGRYTVSTNKENYVRASYGERRPLGPGTAVDVAAGQVVTRIDFVLQRTAAITGRVVDEFGDPAPNVMVMPMRYMYVNGERRLQPAGNSGGSTNDLGEYRVYGLIPGRYFVSATLRPMNVMDDAGDRTAYLPTLYPGTGNPSEAQRFTVGAGQTIAGVNIPLLPVVGSRVSGVVLDINGKPLTMGSVNATSRGLNFTNAGFASIRPDGTFTLNALPPGEYTLRANGAGMGEQYAVADITVSGGDVSDVQLVAVNLSSIRGRIVFDRPDQTQKVPQSSVLRVNVIHPQPSPAVLTMPGGAIPKDDWTFELKTRAGRSILRAGLAAPGNWRLDRILTADGADITDAGFDLPVNGTVDGVVVVMTTRHNEISGTVFDDSGAPVRDCVVVLFAQDPQRWPVGTRLLGVSRPDAENVFHLRVAAGDYFAVAFEQLELAGPSFNDPDILQQLRERAVPFSIGATETKKLDLRLSAPPVY